MKATIHRTDGTRIEAEGTPEEIARLASLAPQFVFIASPCARPHADGGVWWMEPALYGHVGAPIPNVAGAAAGTGWALRLQS